jgi:uncharacterized protein (DUF885 family)
MFSSCKIFVTTAVALCAFWVGNAAYAQISKTKQADQKAEQLFQSCFKKMLQFSPVSMSAQGDYSRNSELDDLSEAAIAQTHQTRVACLAQAREIDATALSSTSRESLDIFIHSTQLEVDGFAWRQFEYPSSPMGGWDTAVFQVFTFWHPIKNAKDAAAYLRRVEQLPRYLSQVREHSQRNEKAGTVLPKPLFAAVFDNFKDLRLPAQQHPLTADFTKKLAKLPIDAGQKAQLVDRLQSLLSTQVLPAIETHISYLKEQQLRAPEEGGLARIAGAALAYDFALRQHTTTTLNAAQVHALGLQTVAKLEEQMTRALAAAGLPSDPKDRATAFAQLRSEERFHYPNTDAGRQTMLREATNYVEQMRLKLPKLFTVIPKAKVIVERMPSFAESGDAVARYQIGTRDGSQPGKFILNMADTRRVPIYTMESLAYHEAIPGHHMQGALALENKNLPEFRQRLWYVAYGEGWALYSEQLAKEVGFYQTPLSEVGRLSGQLWRACRLVVDTGLHSLQWTRAQAVDYMQAHIVSPKSEVQAEVDRYLVWPGQATGYMIGKLRIEALREKAQQELGDQFDIRRFHDTLLASGPVPLDVMDTIVARWIATTKAMQKKVR